MLDLVSLILASGSAQTEAEAQAHIAARRAALGPVEAPNHAADDRDYGAPDPVSYPHLPPLTPPPRPVKAKPASTPVTRPRLVVVPKSSA